MPSRQWPGMRGPPPRLWGSQPRQPEIGGRVIRFTPTPVGTYVFEAALSASLSHGGSPPRLWGSLIRRLAVQEPHVGRRVADRFTPHACRDHISGRIAAMTERIRVTPTPVGITASLTLNRPIHGSPPRLWGSLEVTRGSHYRRQIERFTPTPVGNTIAIDSIKTQVTVHPHACGDHASVCWDGCGVCGSPPRLWGSPSFAAFLDAR